MNHFGSTIYASLVIGLEYCGNCMTMCGTSSLSSDRTHTMVMRDSATEKIISCPSCKKDKKKSVFD